MAVNMKKEVLKVLKRMPEDVTYEDVMYELYFRQRIDRGLKEFETGKTVSHEAVEKSLVKTICFPLADFQTAT